MAELMARMAEIAVSRHEADVLVALGLGSCIGLALLDRALAGRRARPRRAAGVARGHHGAAASSPTPPSRSCCAR